MKTGNAAQQSARMIWSLHVVSLPACIYFNAKKMEKNPKFPQIPGKIGIGDHRNV